MKRNRRSGRKGPDDAVGIAVGRDAWNGTDAPEGHRGLGGKGRDILPVGKGVGLHGLADHAPINIVGRAVTINSGRG